MKCDNRLEITAIVLSVLLALLSAWAAGYVCGFECCRNTLSDIPAREEVR